MFYHLFLELSDQISALNVFRYITFRAAGAVVHGVNLALRGEADTAFCGTRPPGHHAERRRAMGFCIFNNIAVGAAHALAAGLLRVAIVDFDVHHGNGTESIFQNDQRL